MTFTKLGAGKATGTFTLANGQKGTVTLNGRLIVPDSEADEMLKRFTIQP